MSFAEKRAALEQLFEQQEFEALVDQAAPLIFEYEDETDVDFFLLLAKAAKASQNTDDYEYFLFKAKEKAPQNTAVLLQLAEQEVLTGSKFTAKEYLQQILDIDSAHAKAHSYLGDILLAQLDYDTALVHYQKAMEGKNLAQNEQEQIAVAVVDLYQKSKSTAEALAFLEEYFPKEKFQANIEKLRLGLYQTDSAYKEQLKESLALLHQHLPTEVIYILNLAAIEPDHQAAIALYDKAMALALTEKEKTTVLKKRAYRLVQAEEWNKAVADYDALIDQEEQPLYFEMRAEAKEQLKDLKGALQDYSQALKLDGAASRLLKARGLLFAKAKQYDRAAADLTAAIKVTGSMGMAELYYHLGVVYNKNSDRNNSVKMLIKADQYGYAKAGQYLQEKYPEQLKKVRENSSEKIRAKYEAEFVRNAKSPILQQAFGRLWAPNMAKFIEASEKELLELPAFLSKQVLDNMSKELLIITAEGLLFFENGAEVPLEAYYSVEVESEHAILLEVQPVKGGSSASMRISFFEGELLLHYPVLEIDSAAKYYYPVEQPSADQLEKLNNKALALNYMPAIEAAIAEINT
ncbi:tetratricopeptide repeat protein [Saprospira sp. CCB-QB6]|uniref:tetratricopeptide repeat protein n=1 Tax=Saprospira sp. CCB-QB6 TaxID=3023936 RepID=UPI00234B447B|nr:tetratricopeptide repeat protein [Saprospira sp. CCB-QB6]WCL80369.1 tetratricopeptide repeat protein [Saprospira sp. CCB-QB6]